MAVSCHILSSSSRRIDAHLCRERLLERRARLRPVGGEIEAVGEFVAAAAPLAEFRQHARFDPTPDTTGWPSWMRGSMSMNSRYSASRPRGPSAS